MDIGVFKEAERRGHEQVVFFHFPDVGLKALVGIHNTVLGPALGGCRIRAYEDEQQAVDDVLRLSEGMTYKNSIAGLNIGGGKACIIADPNMKEGRRELFLKFGECVDMLGGRYISAEDMGTSVEDINVMREVTKYVVGYAKELGGSGDPSPWTARGVFNAIIAACERRYGSQDLGSRHIAIQGVGHVGARLAKMLKKAGAEVTICDVVPENVDRVRSEFDVNVVQPDAIYDVECDVFAPCAIGQTVNPQTITRLKCDIIAGAANNVLSGPEMHPLITEKNIMYCPDFVINAGGVISVGAELNEGGWNEAWVSEKVRAITQTMHRILDESEKRGKFPEVVAIELAKERIEKAKAEKQTK